MLVLTSGWLPRRWRTRQIALFLLLAWAPTLLYVDHWPTPALLQSDDARISIHAHGPAGDPYFGLNAADGGDAVAGNHADHGHGSAGAQGSSSIVVVAPDGVELTAAMTTLAAPLSPTSRVDGEALNPPSPPPR